MLAKLLLPEQFGLIGMCSVFIAVASAASELGMSAALIQRKEDHEAEVMYSTAFWTGLVWGASVFALISFVIGPFAAYFYEEPILIKLVPALSIGVLLKPLSMVHTVKLTRAMYFKRIATILNISALIAGIAAVIAAYLDFGVWALVINSILLPIIALPLFFRATRWIPSLEWNKTHFKSIFSFGAYSTGTSIFSTLTYNIDNLMIGKLLGAGALGAYSLSFSLTEQLRQVMSNVLNKVMSPVFGKNQDDKKRLLSYFLKIINLNALALYPLMTFFLIFAEDVIIGFFGDKWEAAVLPLKILAVAMMIHLLVNSFTALIRGLGKPELEMKIIIGLTVLVLVPSLYFGITYYGLVGAALAILFNKVCLATIGVLVLKKEIDLRFLQLLKAIKNPIFGVSISATIVLIINYLGMTQFFVLAPLFIIFYGLLIYKLESKNLEVLIKHLK